VEGLALPVRLGSVDASAVRGQSYDLLSLACTCLSGPVAALLKLPETSHRYARSALNRAAT
jgi:hypothetical protein